MTRPDIDPFYDPDTGTITYVVADPDTHHAAIIDPVLDFCGRSGRTGRHSADRIIGHVRDHGLTVEWLLETHVHADHLSAAPVLRCELGGRLGIGARIPEVQRTLGPLFGVAAGEQPFDHLFADDEAFHVGTMTAQVLHTPGHTPACCTFLIGDAAFVGDTFFMPDVGTARADFPGGDARTLYRSLRRILDLPPDTRIFVAHDYPPAGRGPAWETTVADQRDRNVHLGGDRTEDEFVAMRTARDATLPMPLLMAPAVQVNLRAGQLPEADTDGRRYLRLPIDVL